MNTLTKEELELVYKRLRTCTNKLKKKLKDIDNNIEIRNQIFKQDYQKRMNIPYPKIKRIKKNAKNRIWSIVGTTFYFRTYSSDKNHLTDIMKKILDKSLLFHEIRTRDFIYLVNEHHHHNNLKFKTEIIHWELNL